MQVLIPLSVNDNHAPSRISRSFFSLSLSLDISEFGYYRTVHLLRQQRLHGHKVPSKPFELLIHPKTTSIAQYHRIMPKRYPHNEQATAGASMDSSASTKMTRDGSIRRVKDALRTLSSSASDVSAREKLLQAELTAAKLRNAEQKEEIQALIVERDAVESELHSSKRVSSCLQEDFSNSTEMLTGTRLTVHTLLREKELREAQLIAQDQRISDLQANSASVEALQLDLAQMQDANKLLKDENKNLKLELEEQEDWISHIRTSVDEANIAYNNLESKLRVAEDLIVQLQHINKTDTENHNTNRTALLRRNQELKQEIERLTGELRTERSKQDSLPGLDWKKECLRIHRDMKLKVDRLQMKLKAKAEECEALGVQSRLHQRAVYALQDEKDEYLAATPIQEAFLADMDSCSYVLEESQFSMVTTVIDVLPTATDQENTVSSTTTLAENHEVVIEPTLIKEDETMNNPLDTLEIEANEATIHFLSPSPKINAAEGGVSQQRATSLQCSSIKMNTPSTSTRYRPRISDSSEGSLSADAAPSNFGPGQGGSAATEPVILDSALAADGEGCVSQRIRGPDGLRESTSGFGNIAIDLLAIFIAGLVFKLFLI